MQEQILLSVTLDEFKLLMIDVVNDCLSNTNYSQQKYFQTEIIDRDELCKRLSVTEPTVIRWEKKGKIPSLRIGSSVRYDWQIVIDALEKNGKKI